MGQTDKLVIVIDGAARRPEVDEAANAIAELVLLLFTPASHDVDLLEHDLDKHPGSVAIANRWPNHTGMRDRVARYLERVPADRLLDPVPAVPKFGDLLDAEAYSVVASDIVKPCKALALSVLQRLGVYPLDMRAR